MAEDSDQERTDEEAEGEQDENQYGGGDQDIDAVEQTERVNEDDGSDEADESENADEE